MNRDEHRFLSTTEPMIGIKHRWARIFGQRRREDAKEKTNRRQSKTLTRIARIDANFLQPRMHADLRGLLNNEGTKVETLKG